MDGLGTGHVSILAAPSENGIDARRAQGSHLEKIVVEVYWNDDDDCVPSMHANDARCQS